MTQLHKSILFSAVLALAACGRSSIYSDHGATTGSVLSAAPGLSNSSGTNSNSSSGSNSTHTNTVVVRPRITCTSNAKTPKPGSNTITFAPDDCTGGALPDANYVGILNGFAVNNGTSGEFSALQPALGEAAAVWFWAKNDNGNYFVRVTYLPLNTFSDAFFCGRGGAIPSTGSNQVTFGPSDCGGHTPGSDYIAIPLALQSNGGTSGEFGFDQPFNGGTPRVWWWALTPANQGNYAVRVAYVKRPATPVVTCVSTGHVGAAGAQNVTYAASECNGAYPSANATVIPSGLASNDGTSGEFGFNGASVWWWAVAGGSNINYQTVSVFLE